MWQDMCRGAPPPPLELETPAWFPWAVMFVLKRVHRCTINMVSGLKATTNGETPEAQSSVPGGPEKITQHSSNF